MPTTTDDLVALTRQTLDDVIEPYLLSEEQIVTALDRAQREFVDRTLCLQTHRYPLQVTANNPLTYLDQEILQVRHISLGNRFVMPVSMREMNQGYVVYDYGRRVVEDWREITGTPQKAITDAQDGALRWVPIPIDDATAYMDAYVYPTPMRDGEDPAIPQRWRSDLVAGAVMHLYRQRDTEVFDPKAAESWMMTWQRALAEAYAATQRNQRGAQAAQFNRTGVW